MFFVSDPRRAYRRALIAAFDDARAKAQDLAARAGIRLGRVLSIREDGVELEPDREALAGPERGRARPPTRPGRSRVSARLAASFAVE